MKNYKNALVIIVVSLLSLSCGNSTEPLKDGFTLHGQILESISNKGISSVQISQGYIEPNDTIHFGGRMLESDSLGKFTFKSGPGTAPSNEVLKFEHKNYQTQIILLKNNSKKKGNQFSLEIILIPN